VRGMCCLRPGLKNLSANITVRSVVDRFLEHSRIFYFQNASHPQVFISSADWMQRNFFRRIEVAIPVLDSGIRDRLSSQLLGITLGDTVKAWLLRPNALYTRAMPVRGQKPLRSQFEFVRLAAENGELTKLSTGRKQRYPKVRLASSPFDLEKRMAKNGRNRP